MEIWQYDAVSLAQAYREKRLTPVLVVDALLARIDRLDPLINAFVAIAPDCRTQAEESAKRIEAGSPRGPLEGIPVAVKDSLCVAGMTASWGTRVFADNVCDADELPIRRLRDAGAIMIGKTNTSEFAVEGYTANALFGVTGNPWNPDLTPGGSSGGPVAAVAAGFVPVAIGTDGGGSIRRPAAYTGLFGLKPTIGRVPRDGGLPQLLLDFEVAGPLARSLRDCRLFHSVLAGPDPADPRSRRFADENAGRDAKGLRILYVERFADAPCDPAILASCGRAAEHLAALGHNVTGGKLPFDLGAFSRFWSHIAPVGLARLVREIPAMTKASETYLAMAEKGKAVAVAEFAAGLETVDRLRRDVSLAFQNVDLIMLPSCAAMPWPADQAWPETIDGQPVGPRGHAVYTGWVNGAGHPAVAIPAEPSDNGMPIGFQLVGDLGSESLLMDVAEAFEAHTGGWRRWPKLFSGPEENDVR